MRAPGRIPLGILAFSCFLIPAHADDIVYVGGGACYVTGCNEIYEVAPGGALTDVANLDTYGLATDSQGNLFASSGSVYQIAPDGTSTVVGSASGSHGMAFDAAGNLYTTDYYAGTIREYAPGQYNPGNPGSNMADVCCGNLNGGNVNFYDVAFDAAGNMYFTDFNSSAIWKATPSGNLPGSTMVGYDAPTLFVGDGLNGRWLNGPVGLAIDAAGDMYVSEYSSGDILKISSDGSTITTFASSSTTAGLADPLSHPGGIALDASGNLFVTNNVNYSYLSGPSAQILEFAPNGSGSVYASSGLYKTWAIAVTSGNASASAPEPGALLLLASGMARLFALRRKFLR